MSVTLTSTVPGAISALLAHFTNVASQNPALDLSVVDSMPIEKASDNVLMIGHYETGEQVVDYEQNWAAFPASAAWKMEEYGILCSLKVWSGSSDPAARRADIFTVFNSIVNELQSDPGGSDALSASGSWQLTTFTNESSGPFGDAGFGIVITFTVRVINVRIPQS